MVRTARWFFLTLFIPMIFLGCSSYAAGSPAYSDPGTPMSPDANYSTYDDGSFDLAEETPPPLQFAEAPDMVVVPSEGSDVYLAPDAEGLYFYDGSWYRSYGGYWFSSSFYTGPWSAIRQSLVPSAVLVIPPNYIRSMPPGYYRIRYSQFYGNWRTWGQTHYWNSQAWYREHSLHHWGGVPFRRPAPPPRRQAATPRPSPSPRPVATYRPSPSPPPRPVGVMHPVPFPSPPPRPVAMRPAPSPSPPRPAAMHRPSPSPAPRSAPSPGHSGRGRR